MVDFAGLLGLDNSGVSAEFYTAIVVNYIRRPSMNDKAVKALIDWAFIRREALGEQAENA
ncbi:hypothetical protein [Vreelandella alkaliphila]|uniref:hypothetical protein n=1 Tax=Vreelandella alkaliphila TaxID=272774 RepID=UPI003FD89411